MAVENTPKLNLSALLKKESENQTPQKTGLSPELIIEVGQQSQESEHLSSPILNSSIFPEKKVAISIPEAKQEETNILVSAGNPIKAQDDVGGEIIGGKINFLALQKTRTEESEKDKQNKINIKNNEAPAPIVKEKVELFGNYKPSFEGRAKKFFNQLRELRLKARTHIKALTFLCILTGGIVAGAFYFFPEKHSVDIYKANIMAIFSKKNPQLYDVIPEDILPENMPSTNSKNDTLSSGKPSLSPSGDIIETPREDPLAPIEIPKTEEGKKMLRNEVLKKYFLK